MKRLLIISLIIVPLLATAQQQNDSIPAKDSTALVQEKPADGIYVIVDKMPSFMGGDVANFRQWIFRNIKFPKEAGMRGAHGNVIVSFVVNAKGKLTDIKILKSPDKSLSDEVLRVLGESPKWEAGVQSGEKVSVRLTLPVTFKNMGIVRQTTTRTKIN